MDESVKQLLKSFGHIARELQIYFLSGCVILLDLLLIDWMYYQPTVLDDIGKSHVTLFVLGIVAYLLGNVSLGMYYFVRNSLIRLFGEKTGPTKVERITREIRAFKADQVAYAYFVERYSLLHNMRGAMSAAFFIATASNTAILMHTPGVTHCQIVGWSLVGLFVSFSLFVLARGTEARMTERVTGMNNCS